MLSRGLLLILIYHLLPAHPGLAQQPELVVPKGFFMVSAGLNDKGDVVTLSAADKLNVWNLDSLKLRYTVPFNTTGSYNVHFSPDGKFIIAPHTRDSTRIIDAATGNTLFTLDGWVQDILKKEISPDGNTIITTPYKKKVAHVWDLRTGRLVKTLAGHSAAVTYSAYSHDGKLIITGSQDNTLKLWNAQSGALLHTMTGHTGAIFYSCFSDDDRWLASASYDGTARIFEVSTGKLIAVLTGHAALIMDIAFSQDNKQVITCSSDKTAALWETMTGKKIVTLTGHTGDVLTCRFSADDKTVITTSSDGSLKEWMMPAGTNTKTIRFTGGYGTYSVYKNRLIVCNEDRINLYSWPRLKKEYSLLPLDASNYLILDSSGRYDGTESARKLLYFTCGAEVISLDQAKDQLWVPNLAERIGRGEVINAKTLTELNICGLTPDVKDVSSKPGEYFFRITTGRGGLGEAVLLINGIEVQRYKKEQLKKTPDAYALVIKKEELDKFFIAGKDNLVTVKAYTADNSISSRGVIIRENKTATVTTPPNLYAVMVGVSDYKGDELDLKYAAKDAADISKTVAAATRKLLNTDGKEHVFMYNLTTTRGDLLPEKKTIQETFRQIGAKATANDILLIFFAGHGVMDGPEKQFYFLTADASKASATDAAPVVGISTAELTEWTKPQHIKAQKRILIFDACNSGQAIKDFVKLGNDRQQYLAARNDDNVRQIKQIDKLNEKSGLFILSASASDQSAYEMGRYAQGLLTYSLLKAIKQQPDILEEGKYLDISRWFNAAEKTVSDLSKENGARQEPQIVSNTNFNLGIVDREIISGIRLPDEKSLFTASNFQNSDEAADGDNLELSKLINLQLNEIAVRGTESSIVYVTATNSPDAYTLSGRYDTRDNGLVVRVSIKKNNETIHRFEEKGEKDKIQEVARAIVTKAATWVGENKKK